MKARGLKCKHNVTLLTLDCVTNGRKGFVASYFSLCVHNGKLYVLVFKITLKLLVKRVVLSHAHLAKKRRDSIQMFLVSIAVTLLTHKHPRISTHLERKNTNTS